MNNTFSKQADASEGLVRSELGVLPEWDLSSLYLRPDDPALEADKVAHAQKCQRFCTRYKGKIAALESGNLLELLVALEEITRLETRLGTYAMLRCAQDRGDTERSKFQSDLRETVVNANAALVFLPLEINEIPQETLSAYFEKSPGLARYKTLFDALRALKPYQLSDELERFIHDKSVVGSTAWVDLFDETMSAIRFEIDGQELNLEATLDLLTEPERQRREQSARALAKTFSKNQTLLARIHNTLTKEKEIVDRWRGMESPQLSRHLSNQVEAETVQALRDAVVAAYPRLSHRYYALKAKWLGLDVMEIWDRNAPIPKSDDRRFEWNEARDLVLSAYGEFDPQMATLGGKFFDNGWIDAPTRPCKAPGAFSHPASTDANPFILLNYMGKTRDVMTLAHELGHGVHQILAAKQGPLLADTPLTLAETASVFGEMLTFQKLLARARSPKDEKVLLANKTEDMINTLLRQIAFYDFESKLHAARAKGELTPQNINALWMSVQRECLGPAFNFMDGYETFWSYIPHFIHSPFYVYAYAFGDGLVNALYSLYEQGFDGFQDCYRNLLEAGGSKPYQALLSPFGLNACDPSFWDMGLNVISSMIDRLEQME